ncbi:helix-turn-helix transcriptional regulator [Candidatus Woesearchaeota archaeon]|nr:helix-turn-helix transcriptional regulator [Candidatus Woesearchaeota archaeon]
MLSWFFKRAENKRVAEIENSVKNSFQSMKADMNHVGKWINHFKEKHALHESNFQEIELRMKEQREEMQQLRERIALFDKIMGENALKVRVQSKGDEETAQLSSEKEDLPTEEMSTGLPLGQQKVCTRLAALQRENPDKWISLRDLAEEVYPEKEKYDDATRSAISQLVNILVEEGYLAKKRVGKTMYVYLKKSKISLFEERKSSTINKNIEKVKK